MTQEDLQRDVEREPFERFEEFDRAAASLTALRGKP